MSAQSHDLSGLHAGDELRPALGREASPPSEFAPRNVLFLGGSLHGQWRQLGADVFNHADRKTGESWHKVTESRQGAQGCELVEFMVLAGMTMAESVRLARELCP